MEKIKVAIRRGHQRTGGDGCAVGFVNEIEAVEQYMPYIIEELKAKGYEVLDVTPPENNRSLGDSLNYGITKAREFGADLFISCHANAFKTTDNPMGGEVIFPNGDSIARNYALDICNVLKKNGFINRGAKPDVRGLAEMNGKVGCPAIIIEPFFVDSKADVNNFNWVGGVKLGREIGKALSVVSNPNKPKPKFESSISIDGGGTIKEGKLGINLIIRNYSTDIDHVYGYINDNESAQWAFSNKPLNDNYALLKPNANQIYVGSKLEPQTEYNIKVVGYCKGKSMTEKKLILKTIGDKKESPNKPIEEKPVIKYKVQIGSFSNRVYAENLVKEAKEKGFQAFISEV